MTSAGIEIPEGRRLNRYGDLENLNLTTEDWKIRWEKRHIGFHKDEIHGLLQKYLSTILHGRKQIRIFVPLCGKSVDMKWLADQGHTVVGVEASEIAIKEFFAEQNVSYTQESVPGIAGAEVFQSADGKLFLFNCNMFDFSSAIAGKFDGIWDRGSLVAINPSDRQRYAKLMTTLMAKECHYLLDALTYDQEKFSGPPFSTPLHVIHDLYDQSCNIQLLGSSDALTDRQRSWGLDSFTEQIHLITLKTNMDSCG
ncbi:probable thiopurine S-methyltransferase [Hemiscyllium ocellatum]|uniref:probable thiopurine S-methyltransferase n=1 Tax=Hemiscyllium ocellatum TaxID=170820 RepID=UPI002966DFD8|nr:probable thiopurine S-methyltransferase [Hemiscyllium ocellatum]